MELAPIICRQEIFDLAKTNPIISAAIALFLRGELTFEQSIMTAIVAQDARNQNLSDELIKIKVGLIERNQDAKE